MAGAAKMAVNRWFPLTTVLYFGVNIIKVGCSCSEEQKSSCLNAVSSGSLDDLPSGGTCMTKQYVHFTHICTVNNYFPNVDYCCCQHSDNNDDIMCCLYHQDWDFFRCLESNDTIESKSAYLRRLPKEILLPIVFVPVLLLVSFVICWARRRCYDNGDDDNAVDSDSCTLACCRCYSTCGYELAAAPSAQKPQSFAQNVDHLESSKPLYPGNVICLYDDHRIAPSPRSYTHRQLPCSANPTHVWLVHPPSTLCSSKPGYACSLQFFLPAAAPTGFASCPIHNAVPELVRNSSQVPDHHHGFAPPTCCSVPEHPEAGCCEPETPPPVYDSYVEPQRRLYIVSHERQQHLLSEALSGHSSSGDE